MKYLVVFPSVALLVASTCCSSSSAFVAPTKSTSTSTSTSQLMAGLTLYGSQGSRSPLVNWGASEVGVPITMGNLQNNPHPFGQIPCLTDDDDVLVFESGAILQYVYIKAAETNGDSPSRKAAITSWISWANASLDPICFLETPEGKVYVHSTILFSIFYVTDLYLPVLSIYSIYLSFNLSSTFSDCAHITLLFCYFYQK
jgi:hypothetical protein